MTYSVACKIGFVDKIKRQIIIYVIKTSLTEKSLFRKTLMYLLEETFVILYFLELVV